VALALLVGVACSFAPDLSRFPECNAQTPCAQGSTCVAEVGRCLPDACEEEPCELPLPEDGGTDAGPSDAGGDAGTPDAGAPDAGAPDAGAPDAGAPDAGQTDAGLPPLRLVPAAPGRAIEELPYTHPFQADGGTPPYAFTALEALPPGLSLSDGGLLSGTPDAAGSFVLHLQVTDQGTPPQQDQREYPLSIRQRLRVAGPETLAYAPIDEPYEERIQATGGLAPYTFTLSNGGLPAGLFLYGDGGVSGTAQQAISVSFTVQVTDSDTPPQTASGRLNISTIDCSSLCIRTRTLPEGRVGTPYSYTLQRSKGVSPFQWRVKQGALPMGLELASSTGVLSGTPAQAGEVQLVISVTDSTLLTPRTEEFTVNLKVR
jgi:hypothetical protein